MLRPLLTTVTIILCGEAFAVSGAAASEALAPASSAVKIVTDQATGAHGTGVYIGRGMVVTAAHVVDEFTEIEVVTDQRESAGAYVMAVDARHDIAVLRLRESPSIREASLSCTPSPIGITVQAIGNPLEREFTTANGRITGEALPFGVWASVMLLRLSVAPGDSGGPVLNSEGNVIGIVVGQIGERGARDATHLALAVPSIVPCRLIDRSGGF